MNAEFNWWLLILGLAAGAGIAWLVLADLARRDEDLTERERATEVERIMETMAADGWPTAPETIARVLDVHYRIVAGVPLAEDEAAEPGADDVSAEPDADDGRPEDVAPPKDVAPPADARAGKHAEGR